MAADIDTFLSAQEVGEFSGIKRGKTVRGRKVTREQLQVEWLRRTGVPFIVNARGRPMIVRANLVGMASAAGRTTRRPPGNPMRCSLREDMGRKPYKTEPASGHARRRQKSGRTYYYYDAGGRPRREIPLGPDLVEAVKRWADLERERAPPPPLSPRSGTPPSATCGTSSRPRRLARKQTT